MTPNQEANRNVNAFIVFRIFFNSRFYYPVLAILFLDLGLSLEQYAMLNVAWAVSIFCLEVPSGALADMWGRKKLVVIAGVLMVIEMMIFAFTPNQNIDVLFALFLLNRILSGAAEASASGADEALVYDSLKAANRSHEWQNVLAKLGRLQSIAFFVVMIAGAAVYDAKSVNWFLGLIGFDVNFASRELIRMPIYLTLAMSLVTLAASLSMVEAPIASDKKIKLSTAIKEIVKAAKWILASPVAIFVIFAALCNDSFIRLFMTMTSQYFRILNLPEASFGVIGSMSALLGFVSPYVAQRLIKLGSARAAFGVLSLATVAGLFALPYATSTLSLIYVFWLSFAMGIVGFLSSYYLNELADPSQRATILSFRGLSGNLAYGGLGILFAGCLKLTSQQHPEVSDNAVFLTTLSYLPWMFLTLIAAAYTVRFLRLHKRNRKGAQSS